MWWRRPIVLPAEFPMVLNDAGTVGLTLNGKSFPATAPIMAKEGDKILVHYMNEGLTDHPMHLHRQDQLVVAKDGFPVADPQRMNTVSIAPGETWDVILSPQFAGTWIWHCHVLAHATGPRDEEGNETSAGMIGTVVVEDGETSVADLATH